VSVIIYFVLGLAVGSFLNVLSLRYQPGQSILFRKDIFFGRSHCLHCGRILRWYELLPLVSFVIQKGRCRSCGTALSWQYPLVEFLSGILAVIWLVYFSRQLNWLQLAIFLVASYLLLLQSLIDFRWGVIPDQLNLLLAVLGIILIFINQPISFIGSYGRIFSPLWLSSGLAINRLASALLSLLIFGAIILFSRGRGMGWGDFKLAGALGLLLGWPDALLGFMLSFVIGAAAGLILLLMKKKSLKDSVPFGPFLALGALLVMFWGENIVRFYFGLVSF